LLPLLPAKAGDKPLNSATLSLHVANAPITMSAFVVAPGVEADMSLCGANVAFDPKRTSPNIDTI
jgi:hypothetical protein